MVNIRREDIERLNRNNKQEAICWICEKVFPVPELLVVEIFISNFKHKRMLKGYVFKCKDCDKKW